MKEFRGSTSNDVLVNEAKDLFVSRFRRHFSPSEIVQRLVDAPSSREGRVSSLRVQSKWLVLSFHPVLERAGFRGALQSFCQHPAFRDLWTAAFGREAVQNGLRLAWRRFLK